MRKSGDFAPDGDERRFLLPPECSILHVALVFLSSGPRARSVERNHGIQRFYPRDHGRPLRGIFSLRRPLYGRHDGLPRSI